MWEALLDSENNNYVVVCNHSRLIEKIDCSLFQKRKLFTIVLDNERAVSRSVSFSELQIIHSVEEAVFYRNFESDDHLGWVLFVSSENGLLQSISSVATIVKDPEWRLLRAQLELIYDAPKANEILKLARKRNLDIDWLWQALSDVPENLLRHLGILEGSHGESLQEYNKQYTDEIEKAVRSEEAFEAIIEDLSDERTSHFRNAIQGIREKTIGNVNLEESISGLFRDADYRALLRELDLPFEKPNKLVLRVTTPDKKKVFKLGENWFVLGLELDLKIEVKNTDCHLSVDAGDRLSVTKNLPVNGIERIRYPIGEEILKIRASKRGVKSVYVRLFELCVANEGIYDNKGKKLDNINSALPSGGKRQELSVDISGPASKFYIVHPHDAAVKIHGARVTQLLENESHRLSQLSAFDFDGNEIFFQVGGAEFIIPNYDNESSRSESVTSSIIRRQKEALYSKGAKIYTTRDDHPIHDLERELLLEQDAYIALVSENSEGLTKDDRGFLFSSDMGDGVVSAYGNVSAGSELIEIWKKIRSHFLTVSKSFDLSMLQETIETIDDELVIEYYNVFTKELQENILGSKFLTINFFDSRDRVQFVALPIFHPVVLHDAKKYFDNYKSDDSRVHLNAGHTIQSLKSLRIHDRTFFAIDKAGICSYLFGHEEALIHSKVRERLQISELARPLQEFLPLAENQVFRAVQSMFDYLGFKRNYKILLRIDDQSELRTFASHLNGKFNDQLNRVIIEIFVESEIFGSLVGYYAQENENIIIRCRSTKDSRFDLIIDTRQSSHKLRRGFREADRKLNGVFAEYGFNVASYNYTSRNFEAVFTYPPNFVAHRLISTSNQETSLHVTHIRQDDDELITSEGQIICMQLEKFAAMRNQVDHVVFEMKANNRVVDSALAQANFIIAIRNTNQLENRIRESINRSLRSHQNLSNIKRALLRSNLFSFNQILGNQNKMQGTLGELCVFSQLQDGQSNRKSDLDVVVIPFDHLAGELEAYFDFFQESEWSQFPDFIVLNVHGHQLSVSLVEVKTRRDCEYRKVFDSQLKPIAELFEVWLGSASVNDVERKRFIIFLIQFVLETNVELLSHDTELQLKRWLSHSESILFQSEPIIFHLCPDEGQLCEVVDEEGFFVVKGSYREEVQALTEDVQSFSGKSGEEILRNQHLHPVSNTQSLAHHDGEANSVTKNNADPRVGAQSASSDYNKTRQKLELGDKNRAADVDLTTLESSNKFLLEKYQSEYVNTRRWFSRNRIELTDADPGVLLSPMAVRFYYVLSERNKLKQITALEADLALQLKIEEGESIDVFGDKGKVVIEIPLSDGERQFFKFSSLNFQSIHTQESALSVPIGVDMYGDVLTFAFGDNSPHLLIAGTTGSGKSVALEVIIGGFLTRYDSEQIQFVIVDPKQTELIDFELFDGVKNNCLGEPIGSTPRDACRILSLALDEMTRRLDLFASTSKTLRSQGQRSIKNIDQYNSRGDAQLPRLVVVLDEYADLVSSEDDKKEIEALLVQLAQKSRSAGIHLIVATQKPIVEVLSTVVKGNLPAVLALRVNSQSDSRVVLDEGGAERLLGKGDALLKIGGQTRRLQIAQFDQWP